jgi:hypothetical protein
LAAWRRAVSLFNKGEVGTAYLAFFEYLRDEKAENVRFTHIEKNNEIRFEFYQGSKHIIGTITEEHIAAFAKVVTCESLNVGFMRRLLAKNAHLLYTNFTLDEHNDICIRFSSAVVDCSPQKLYFSLKELALSADKEDDLLLSEFPMLHAVDSTHIQPFPKDKADYCFAFFKTWLATAQQRCGTLDGKRNSGIIAFVLLDLVYKIDALLQPEGKIMETCDRTHQHYFANERSAAADKLPLMLRELDALQEISEAEFEREMYHATATFGITRAVKTTQIRDFIAEQLPNIQHYLTAQQPHIAQAIIGFVVGSCFFNYALPKPQRAVFDLWYRTSESEFFKAQGEPTIYYDAATQTLQKQAILDKIATIIVKHAADYPDFQVDIDKINFENIAEFGASLLTAMI